MQIFFTNGNQNVFSQCSVNVCEQNVSESNTDKEVNVNLKSVNTSNMRVKGNIWPHTVYISQVQKT